MFSVIGNLDNYREGEILNIKVRIYVYSIMLCWMVEHDDYIFRKVTLKCVRLARVKGRHILF